MSKSVPKRMLSWLIAAMVALLVAPGSAFAADLTGAAFTPQATSGVLKVCETAADGTTAVAKDFTQAELENLAKQNSEPVKYMFMGKGKLTIAVATKYVTFEQLADAAGFAFEEGDLVNAVEADADDPANSFVGPSASYADVKAGMFCPAYTTGDKSVAAAEATPGVFALEWGSVDAADASTTAGSLVADAVEASTAGYRNFWGYSTDAAAAGEMAGKPFVKNANELHFAKGFNVYTRTGNGAQTLVKSFTATELKGLATTPASAEDAPGFLFDKNGWQVGTTTSYIPVETLLGAAGITLKNGEKVAATASDGFTTYLTYDQIKNAKYFYPAATASKLDAAGAETVGAVLALNWAVTGGEYADGSGTAFPTVDASGTAGAAKAAMFDLADKFNAQTRVFVGLTSTSDSNTGGNRFATGPVEMSVVTMKDVNECTVSGIDASYTYTGEAIEPEVTVKDGSATLKAATRKGGDYEVAYENNIEVGTATVTIKGVNAYTGTKTITFKVAGIDLSKASVSVKGATYTGKAITPEPTVKLGDATLAKGTDYTVAYKNNKNAGTATVTITGKGHYAGTASKTFAIAKASGALTVKAALATQKATYGKKVTVAAAKAFKVSANTSGGKVTYAKTSGNAKIAVSKAGKVTVAKGLAAGTYTVKVKATAAATANYKAATSKVFSFKVKVAKAANVLKLTAKTGTVKAAKVKKAAQKLTVGKVAKVAKNTSKGKLTYKKLSGNKKIVVAKNGKVTVKKGCKAGTYKVKVKVTSAATKNYKAKSTTVTFKVKVK